MKADKKQLENLNELNKKDLSKGEVYERVFPEKFNKMPETLKNALYELEFKIEKTNKGEISKYFPEDIPVSVYQRSKDVEYQSRIGTYGKSIKFWSWLDHPLEKDWMYIETKLVDDHTKEIIGYVSEVKYDTSYLKVTGYLDPPTGRYYTHGDHIYT